MRAFHFYLHALGISAVQDTQCGFKLLTRATAALIFPAMHFEGWVFDIEILLLATLCGVVPVAEVAITWHEVEGSKVHLVRDSMIMAIDLIIMRVNYALGRWHVPGTAGRAKVE